MAFLGGSTGVIYRQFSITIATAMTLSVLVAIMFTPALCATILRQTDVDHSEQNRFFRWFNRRFNASSESYGRSEEHTSELQSLMRISYAVFCLKKKTSYSRYYYYPST